MRSCAQCGAAERQIWADGRCVTCHYREREAGALALADLPAQVRNRLLYAGYWSRAAVARATDEELQSLRNIGPKGMARLRAAIPYTPARHICPTCNGTGLVDDAPDA